MNALILLCPPFPGANIRPLGVQSRDTSGVSPDHAAECVKLMRENRIGGTFWGAQNRIASGLVDPWWLFRQTDRWRCHADDETALLARIAGLHVHVDGNGRFADCDSAQSNAPEELIARHILKGIAYHDPFFGLPVGADIILRQLAEWRKILDANRELAGAMGIARWKRSTVTPLLWNGSSTVRYTSKPDRLPDEGRVAVWKSRTSKRSLDLLDRSRRCLTEIEDGFIRSSGLGADCVPPLSIILDDEGIYFDPSKPSTLERLLNTATFTPQLLARADALHRAILHHGISKYGAAITTLPRPADNRRHVLVTGQVEDDRSILSGGGAVRSNLDLLKRARMAEADAYIIYKPHPDVEAGHRIGHIAEDQALIYADAIIRDQPIGALLDMVDAVHVITSLAGFEGLLRGKQVTTHGLPFYAGWGLTTDLAEIPHRRGTRRSLLELIAATLILYPRYMDPVTGLPCPPEVLIERMASGADRRYSALVEMRRVQGKAKRWLAARIGRGLS